MIPVRRDRAGTARTCSRVRMPWRRRSGTAGWTDVVSVNYSMKNNIDFCSSIFVILAQDGGLGEWNDFSPCENGIQAR